MRVLITGSAGFIGSNLADKCVERGWSVTGVDDLSNGHIEFVHDLVDHHTADFTADEILQLIKQQKFDVVFHFAAIPRVSYSVEHPVETNDVNVGKTMRLIEACKGNVKRFVFASSSSVYGGAPPELMPTHESCKKNPKSPYALQKSIIEDYLLLYANLYGLDSACMRFFNVFGPRQLGDTPYSTAVSAWLNAIKRGLPMRSDGDGSQSRDMCYVDNVVDASIKIAECSRRLDGRCYNVACGDRVSNHEILEFLMDRYPFSYKVNAPWRPGDVMHTQADISRAHDELGYVPLVKFWEGLEKTIEWVEKTPEFLTLGGGV